MYDLINISYKKIMKNQKGMGHITTTICIVIISLLVLGIAYNVQDKYQEEKAQNYETDMLLIQGKVKVMGQEATIQKNEELLKGRKVSENLEDEEVVKLLENKVISQDEEKFSKYYILAKENLEEIGLNGIELNEGYYIVNYDTYEIIFTKGVSIEESTFYKLSELQAQDESKSQADVQEATNTEETNNQESEPKETEENSQE